MVKKKLLLAFILTVPIGATFSVANEMSPELLAAVSKVFVVVMIILLVAVGLPLACERLLNGRGDNGAQ